VIFSRTEIAGVWVIDVEEHRDQRGFFARCWCRREFAAHGLSAELAQASVAFSRWEGTLRGLHYQAPPHGEEKLVRATRGAAYVVAVDLRPDSPTHTRWVAVELTAENHRMLYVPQGCAQGYQTLADDTEMFYQMSQFHAPQAARGVRFDDPALAISWPQAPTILSQADRSWPAYAPGIATEAPR
jgi:dTDP-4-dehydrorhamnose 3,5-epimerase